MKQNPQVLLVDNDPQDARVVREVLESAGLGFHLRTSGSSAIEAFHAIQPDLVLIDSRVPEGNGVDISRELKQTEQGRDVPIILMSSESLEPRRQARTLKASGCAMLLQKPLTPQDLLDTLWRFLPHAFIGEAPAGDPSSSLGTEADDPSGLLDARFAGTESFDEETLAPLLDRMFPSTDSGDLARAIARGGPSAAPNVADDLSNLLDQVFTGPEAHSNEGLPAAGDAPETLGVATPSRGLGPIDSPAGTGSEDLAAEAALSASSPPPPDAVPAAPPVTPSEPPPITHTGGPPRATPPVVVPSPSAGAHDAPFPGAPTAMGEAGSDARVAPAAAATPTNAPPLPGVEQPQASGTLAATPAAHGGAGETLRADRPSQERAPVMPSQEAPRTPPVAAPDQAWWKPRTEPKISRKGDFPAKPLEDPSAPADRIQPIAIADSVSRSEPVEDTLSDRTLVAYGAPSKRSEKRGRGMRAAWITAGAVAAAAGIAGYFVLDRPADRDLRPVSTPPIHSQETREPLVSPESEATNPPDLSAEPPVISEETPILDGERLPAEDSSVPEAGAPAGGSRPDVDASSATAGRSRTDVGASGAPPLGASRSSGGSRPGLDSGPAPKTASEGRPPQAATSRSLTAAKDRPATGVAPVHGASRAPEPRASSSPASPEGAAAQRSRTAEPEPRTGTVPRASEPASVAPPSAADGATRENPDLEHEAAVSGHTEAAPAASGDAAAPLPTVDLGSTHGVSDALVSQEPFGTPAISTEPFASPIPRHRSTPRYPLVAMSMRLTGTVGLLVRVSPEGTVTEVRVTKSATTPLDKAAVAAAQTWTYHPARQGTRPVSAWVEEFVEFKLK